MTADGLQPSLVYIPEQLLGFPYLADANLKPALKGIHLGVDLGAINRSDDPGIKFSLRAAVQGSLLECVRSKDPAESLNAPHADA